jgi:exodeoxyribonuclease-5
MPNQIEEDPNQIEYDGKIKLSSGKEIQLNAIQIEAVLAGRKFLSSNDSFFCLSGSAGTGKSTVAKEILCDFQGVVVTAPTHKAKHIIGQMTGYKSATIHSLIGLRPAVELAEFTQNNVLFDLTDQSRSKMKDYNVILIDESSMLPSPLVKLIKQKATELRVKIIFMGDPRQLPPVKEDLSLVFKDPDIIQFRLEKVERQQVGNPLISLYDKILPHIDAVDESIKELQANQEIEEEEEKLPLSEVNRYVKVLSTKPYDLISDITPEGLGYQFFDTPQEFGERLLQDFQFGEDLGNKILCWSNKQVRMWNNFVRSRKLGNSRVPIQVGEILMAYSTVQKEDWRMGLLFENSADYIVKKVNEGYLPAEKYKDESSRKNINGWHVTIQDLDSDGFDFSPVKDKIFIVSPESYRDFARIEQHYADYAKKAEPHSRKFAWKVYYEFRNKFQILGDITNQDLGITSGKPDNVVVKKDFDFGYAQTVHKSQGSTYNNAYLVMNDILSNPNEAEKWRLAYVALSRSSKASFILQTK